MFKIIKVKNVEKEINKAIKDMNEEDLLLIQIEKIEGSPTNYLKAKFLINKNAKENE